MQSLGCDVAALNTVQFSNHTGYKQWKGTRVSAQEITDLFEGLKMSYLDNFDMMLSGYIPGAPAVYAVGKIAEELKTKAKSQPGSFFWVLDPVMGDNGNLYVAQDVVPAYKSLIQHADLILPNQFEAELLSDVKITDMDSLAQAVQVLHERYQIPHIVITSVSLEHPDHPQSSLSVVGSTMTSDRKARSFKIVFPAIDAYFSGTGDMFAALMVVRMREAVHNSSEAGLEQQESWISEDGVAAVDLPLARATEKVLASMHEVLTKTCDSMRAEVKKGEASMVHGTEEEDAKALRLIKSKAAELRLVRHLGSLREPVVEFRAQKM
ncbi:putative pyridoxal kinase protein [Phaeoacremonium minimum UCRPA7]|uniref:pyridoxal kinase n=1 Tax=Phaeoacremonium minimum (strain UCR-PA7) TaxID=1286976 RepID=R8BC85_PHAM7|nr:putative pyridoxal kinase protein [Phaeoacremonium minimum UCRPA7]EON96907.1 putative pyridoxal kinase protein [Phaeoacremonium minimum UCRPA7]